MERLEPVAVTTPRTPLTFSRPLGELLRVVLENSAHVFGPHGHLFGLDEDQALGSRLHGQNTTTYTHLGLSCYGKRINYDSSFFFLLTIRPFKKKKNFLSIYSYFILYIKSFPVLAPVFPSPASAVRSPPSWGCRETHAKVCAPWPSPPPPPTVCFLLLPRSRNVRQWEHTINDRDHDVCVVLTP